MTTTIKQKPKKCMQYFPSANFTVEYYEGIDYTVNSIIFVWPKHKVPISFKKGSVFGQIEPALSRWVLARQHVSSMEPAFPCCEHIPSSLTQVPGLLGQQLLTINDTPVIMEHSLPGLHTTLL